VGTKQANLRCGMQAVTGVCDPQPSTINPGKDKRDFLASHGQNLALTVLYVPSSLDSGMLRWLLQPTSPQGRKKFIG
jgi:hypothetical protein